MHLLRIPLYLLCLFGTYLPAQVTLSAVDNPVIGAAAAPAGEVTIGTEIIHLISETRQYRWTKSILALQGGQLDCVCGVVDNFLHWAPITNSQTFTLGPNETVPYSIYLSNSDTASACCAIVQMRFEEVADSNNQITVVYQFGACATGTTAPLRAAVRVQPNPVRDAFTLAAAPVSGTVKILGLDGRLVQSYPVGERPYSVAGIPPGTYLVELDDPRGNFIKLLQIIKI